MNDVPLLQEALKQTFIAGLLLFFLYKVWNLYLVEKKQKDEVVSALMKQTMLWEERYSKESQDDRDIIVKLSQILDKLDKLK